MADLLPNLLVPGVTKAGTTSLYGYLCQHPDIHGGDMKEINFFGPLKDGHPLPGLDRLAAHFDGAGAAAYRLDVSPQYLHGGSTVVTAIAEALPEARILIMLRNPVPRLFSAYGMQRFKGNLPADMDYPTFLDRCFAVSEHGVQSEDDRRYRALAVADYGTHVPLWLAAYGDAVRVGFTETLKSSPRAFLRAVFTWLDLPPDVADDLDLEVRNATFQHRNAGLAKVAQQVNAAVGRTLERHPAIKHAVRGVYQRLNGQQAEAPAEDAASSDRVREFYRPSVQRLADALTPEQVLGAHPAWLQEFADDR